MRKLKIQVQVSADGYMGSVEGDVAWAVPEWTADMSEHVAGIQRSVDCILLGRQLAEGFIPSWAAQPEGEDEAAIEFMNRTPRVVFSNSLDHSPWPNATILGGDLPAAVRDLKSAEGGDIVAYGGSRLVSGLLAGRLVDELHLLVNPVAIGKGIPVFAAGRQEALELLDARRFECGVTALVYRCA